MKTIVQETQPAGTKATIVGKNVARPDIIYENANGARVASVEVKTGSGEDAAEASIRKALKMEDTPDIVALQMRNDTNMSKLICKIRAINKA